MTDQELYEGMSAFLTADRKRLFDRIVKDRTRHVSVLLEDIYRSQNASAVLRTCDVLGIQDIHIIEDRNRYKVDPDVALGSSKWVDLYKHPGGPSHIKGSIDGLKRKGYRIIATGPHYDGSISLSELPIDRPMVFMFGNELDGLSAHATACADEKMHVPMFGFTESLNISVCAAIVLHDVMQRIRKSDVDHSIDETDQLLIKLQWTRATIRGAQGIEDRLRSVSK